MSDYLCPRCRSKLVKYGEKYRCPKDDCFKLIYYSENEIRELNPDAILYLGLFEKYAYLYLGVDKETLTFGFYSSKLQIWYYPYTFKDITVKITSGEEVIYKAGGANPSKMEATMLDEDGNIVDKYFLSNDKIYNVAITVNDIEFTGFFSVWKDVKDIRELVTMCEVLRKGSIKPVSDDDLTHDEALRRIEDLKKLKNDGDISDNDYQDLKKKYIKFL